MSVFGDKIKNVRESKTLNQKQFANKCGISQQLLSHIETGKRRPNPAFLKTLMSITDFLSAEEQADLNSAYFTQTYGIDISKREAVAFQGSRVTFFEAKKTLPKNSLFTPKLFESDFQEILAFLKNDYELRNAILFLIKWKDNGRLLKKMAANRRIRKIIKDIALLEDDEVDLIDTIQKLVHKAGKRAENNSAPTNAENTSPMT
jgi:transcriptional regulator with XRE-family HTH domain